MHGRRIYHARGKVLGGSSSINGQIFQRGNPLDYERWGADPGMETWDFAHCLPYFKKMETAVASPARRSVARSRRPAGRGAGPGHEPAVRSVLRRRPGGRLPAHRRRERVPAGRVRAIRPEHPQGASTERRPRVSPSDPAPALEPVRLDLAVRHTRPVRGIARGRRRGRARRWWSRRGRPAHGRRGDPRGRSHRSARSCCCFRASAPPTSCASSASMSSRTGRVSGATCRTTSRSTSSTRACAPSRCSRPRPSYGGARSSGRSGCSCGPGRAPPTTSRVAASSGQRGRRLPEPDVPFPAAGDPLRRHGRRQRPRLPGPCRSDVLGRARHRSRSGTAIRASIRSCASTTSRPTRTGANGSRRSRSPGTSSTSPRWMSSTAARRHPVRRSTPERDPRLGVTGRRDGTPPVVHRPDGRR